MSGLHRSRVLILACVSMILGVPVCAQGVKNAEAAPGSFVQVGAPKLYFEECGSSPQTVVLVHDGVLHSAVWDDVWPEFCKHFHTIRYDRRGYGRSSAATEGFFATDDLAAILHHLKVTRTVLVGSSHGGEISIKIGRASCRERGEDQ